LNHTDLALETGSTPEQVTETIRTVASVVGLADLDKALKARGSVKRLDSKTRNALKKVSDYFGKVPECFKRRLVFEDPAWLNDLLKVTSPAYDLNSEIMNPRLRAFVALAAAAVVGWGEGISMYSKVAVRFGAKKSETDDIIKSVFKTSVSNSMACGFRTPCHVPNLEQYRTILSSYVESGALSKRNGDRLTVSSRSKKAK
jgi:alkylhydroperoxidase/carboxymuconolactone decarboxylase family protein YurZ